MSLLEHIVDVIVEIGHDMKAKEDVLNWWSLVRGASNIESLGQDSTGKKYAYTYGSTVLYRYIKSDKTDDSFFTDIDLTNKISTKKVEVNL